MFIISTLGLSHSLTGPPNLTSSLPKRSEVVRVSGLIERKRVGVGTCPSFLLEHTSFIHSGTNASFSFFLFSFLCSLFPSSCRITAAVIMLCVFAILANYEITQLIKASEDEIIPNLNDIIDSLGSIEKGVNTSYEMTTYMPLLYEMNDLSKGIEGNLSITVNAMISSPLFLSG